MAGAARAPSGYQASRHRPAAVQQGRRGGAVCSTSIHSLDRGSLLDALVKEADKAERFPAVYVQVNIGEEEQKGGCAIAEVGALVEAVRASPLPLAGLMAIPPLGLEPSPLFRAARQARAAS